MYRYYSSVEKNADGNPIPDQPLRVVVIGEHSNGVLTVAVACCGKKDRYIKKKGRAIAEGRVMSKTEFYAKYPMVECDVKTFVHIAKEIENDLRTTNKLVTKMCEVKEMAEV